jgi:hypothetical protein
MKIDEKVLTRLEDLVIKGEEVLKTRREPPSNSIGFDASVDLQMATQWMVSCLSILQNVFGENSSHYKMFEPLTRGKTTFNPTKKCLGVIKAAKDDYENGYLFDTRALIEAEVFDDFLEQAEHLLIQGYFAASAVIAGSVLEDGLRKLCAKNGLTLSAKPKLDTMNAELAKAGVYNLLKQKQITALADLRNKAAHGQGGFTKEDVEDMIRNVRRFMEDYFS